MRVLRLGNSYDTDPNIAAAANKVSVADRLLAEGSGEQVETTVRTVWPQPQLPGLIDQWLDRYRPDVALLVVSSYWFTYVSVPVKVQRTVRTAREATLPRRVESGRDAVARPQRRLPARPPRDHRHHRRRHELHAGAGR